MYLSRQSFTGICLVFALYLSYAPCAQAQEAHRFLQWTYEDGLALSAEVGTKFPLYAASTSAILLLGIRADEPFLDDVQEDYRGVWGRYLNVVNELGGPRMAGPLVGLAATSLLTDDQRFQDAAFTSLQAWIFAGGISYGLKHAVGRFRPEDGNDPYAFHPFSGNSSFPSGHTTAAFAIVTPWVMYYPHPLTYGLYGIAASTAIARIARDKHWPTDVFAGAALGFFTARWLTLRHQGSDVDQLGPIQFSSQVGPGGIVLLFRW